MKLAQILLLSLSLTGFYGCAHSHSDHDGEHHDEVEVEGADEHHHDDDEIILSPDDAARFGVVTEIIQQQPFYQTIKVTGEVSAPETGVYTVTARKSGKIIFAGNISAGTMLKAGQTIGRLSASGYQGGDQTAADAIRLESAKKELDRLTPLYKEGVVSQKDYAAAEAEYRIAEVAANGSSTSSTVVSPVSGRVSNIFVSQNQFLNAGDPILNIVDTKELTLRADLPVKYSKLLSDIVSARYSTAESDTVYDIADMNGRLISSNNNMVSKGGYIPVQFKFDNVLNTVAGAYADIYLICKQTKNCISLPRTAISEEQGAKFVFVKIDDHGYEKRNVSLGNSDGQRVAILKGLQPGEEVVTEGTVFVKLAQTKNVMPEGHSHHH
ncbi:MAG: efflux RND transporter periplasmic adaptor subunit [Muribaculum sp.]|nr:efflux RND transporter periplasmic adaptor subunit [Muribaculaceae bacterium]MCM1080868.1 efflux RND transporter periplasmic adaptor subunit [Muribaculum sp.]